LISGYDEVMMYNNKLSSPTVSIEAVMMQMAIAAFENQKVITMDITSLNASMGEIKSTCD
jgi:hypothetical protein